MFLSALVAAVVAAQPAQPTKPFEFKDGDRIAWIGNTLVEREQRYGYWETALLAVNSDKNIRLRNLGWSGDTVFGEARGSFDFNNPDKCFRLLVDQALGVRPTPTAWVARVVHHFLDQKYAFKPTVIFISYGTNESFEGKEGLQKFEKGLEKLLDALKPANARIVLFTPLPFEKSESLSDPKPMNEKLAMYSKVIKSVAEKRGHYLADLNESASMAASAPISENGMHLSEYGYKYGAGRFFLRSLSLGVGDPTLVWDIEPLRKAIITKNELFFHHWRPQNHTYLFGFRKHEQGNNAKDTIEFEALVLKADEEIAKLRKELKK